MRRGRWALRFSDESTSIYAHNSRPNSSHDPIFRHMMLPCSYQANRIKGNHLQWVRLAQVTRPAVPLLPPGVRPIRVSRRTTTMASREGSCAKMLRLHCRRPEVSRGRENPSGSWLQEQQRRKLNGLRLCEPVQRAAISSAYFERSSSLLEPSDPGRRCGKAQSSVQAM